MTIPMIKSLKVVGVIIISLLVSPVFSSPFKLLPHEDWIKGLYSQHDVDKPIDIFEKVFAALPNKVTVYPSENYYYFRFATDGSWYWGNLRLSHDVSDQGKIHFAYARHHDYSTEQYLLLGAKQGVKIEKLKDYIYKVSFKEKDIVFNVNNDPQHPPKGLTPIAGEEWLGRSTDESGFRFLLYFNTVTRHFYWVLDPDQPVKWIFIPRDNHVLFHPDSAFAFYQDPIDKRLVLLGVNESNVGANNYYDGPFDQIADNMIASTKFSEYVQSVYPETKGKINKYGIYKDQTRVAIVPYLSYTVPSEVTSFVNSCLVKYKQRDKQYRCLFAVAGSTDIDEIADEP